MKEENKVRKYRLKFYGDERREFPTEFNMKITQDEAEKITKKLSRHFKFTAPEINFRYNREDCGLAKLGGWIMNLPKSPNLGIMIHELAHFHNYEKYKNSNHSKKLMKTIRRFVNYCRKKNYWRNEDRLMGDIK